MHINGNAGLLIEPLAKELEEYHGIVGILQCKHKVNNKQFMKILNKYKHFKFTKSPNNIVMGYVKSFPQNINNGNCLDFAQSILIDMKLINKPHKLMQGLANETKNTNYEQIRQVILQ